MSDEPLQFPRLATSRHLVVHKPEPMEFVLDFPYEIASPGIDDSGPHLKIVGVDYYKYGGGFGSDASAFAVASLNIDGVRILRDYFAQVVHWMEAEQGKQKGVPHV